MEINIKIIRPNDSIIEDVIKLGDANSKTLGFLPQEAFREKARKGLIIIATDSDAKYSSKNNFPKYLTANTAKKENYQGSYLCLVSNLLGYLLYRENKDYIAIVHLCVAEEVRKDGISEKLMFYIKELSVKKTKRAVKLNCRRDYGLDNFWKRLGFIE